MDVVLCVLAVICLIIGVFGSFLPVLPGPPICFVGMLLVHWATGAFESAELIRWGVIVGVVTIADNFLPPLFTKRFGGSKRATWGSMIGVVVGLFFGIVGVILGPFVGALIGELSTNNSDSTKAFKVAFGSFVAFIFGSGIKVICCVAIAIPVFGAMF